MCEIVLLVTARLSPKFSPIVLPLALVIACADPAGEGALSAGSGIGSGITGASISGGSVGDGGDSDSEGESDSDSGGGGESDSDSSGGGGPGGDASSGGEPSSSSGEPTGGGSGDEPMADPCAAIAAHPSWELCASGEGTCTAVFSDSAGCAAVCAAAGMSCAQVFEDLDGLCAPDLNRPELACAPGSGHKSDYCVCTAGGEGCEPSCDGASCGPDGCGGVCGSCPGGQICNGGACFPAPDPESVMAFPGAEGEGMRCVGGRGGDVYHVTTLADSGAGSLRAGVGGSGARTIVFDVAGIITLNSPLVISRSKLTIAGQSAPGGGIVIRGYQTEVKANDVVIRHVRFRAGDLKKKKSKDGSGFTEDSLTLQGSCIIVDHVSASWGIDESLSGGSSFQDVTVQYSIIAEGLRKTCLFHGEYDCSHPGHSMGSLFKPKTGDSNLSIHHSLFFSNNNRNPAIGAYESGQSQRADLRNNVIYNCPSPGYVSGQTKKLELNYVGNYLIFGPSNTSSTHMFQGEAASKLHIFQKGNLRDLNKNGAFDGKDDGWAAIKGTYTQAGEFSMRPVTTHSAKEALELVLAGAGALPWARDSVDLRIIKAVKEGKGAIIDSQDDVGGWGTIDAGQKIQDSDGDGMSDVWELARGLDPNFAGDRNGDDDLDGYTNLEEYLDARANP